MVLPHIPHNQAAVSNSLTRGGLTLPQPVPEHLAGAVPLLRAIVADAGPDAFAQPHRFDDATWVGYRLAEILPIPTEARLRLLELDDTISRLEIIHAFLRQHQLID